MSMPTDPIPGPVTEPGVPVPAAACASRPGDAAEAAPAGSTPAAAALSGADTPDPSQEPAPQRHYWATTCAY